MGSDRADFPATDVRFNIEILANAAQSLAVALEPDEKSRRVLAGYVQYLLAEKGARDYMALAEYLELYGRKYLLPEVEKLLIGEAWQQIVELGPGTGWLVKALGPFLGWGGKRYAIDARSTLFKKTAGVHFQVRDLEKNPFFLGLPFLTGKTGPTLIVANQFLHCVDNWKDIIKQNRAEWLCIEVSSPTWKAQMRSFGATPLTRQEILKGFLEAEYSLSKKTSSSLLDLTLWVPA